MESEPTSWEIVRATVVTGQPNTIGGRRQLILASDLFVKLLPNLSDSEEAVTAWKSDSDMIEALASRPQIDEMVKCGVIQGGFK